MANSTPFISKSNKSNGPLAQSSADALRSTKLYVAEGMSQTKQDDYSETSPIFKLPPELLARIFQKLVPDSINGEWNDSKLLPISHVHRFWRSIALDIAALWTILLFCLNDIEMKLTKTCIYLYQLQILDT